MTNGVGGFGQDWGIYFSVDPKDYIDITNLAKAYKLKGDIANAIKCYELAEKNGDTDVKDVAQKALLELRKYNSLSSILSHSTYLSCSLLFF